ncbi:alkaline phosphatase family protein [Rheinheimera riviphila]|uniref:Alkaline phosphatase family protein n=1 Tax=Rheinheimera riviphila TaxID=1834037 RepID=A0A437QR91_9GAMM|nr:LTA synthase family protein [Rheinheimera riviphila]RVU37031.1 alkaline phosphatase family protein [Rheinheimera riviphila]
MLLSVVANFRRLLAPYQIFGQFLILALGLLSISRLGLLLWQFERVQQTGQFGWLLLQGVRADLMLLGLLLAIPLLLLPLAALARSYQRWQRFSYLWCLAMLGLIIFIELSTPAFIAQYDIRPNRLYLEYLKYPKEVFATLWHGFRGSLLLGLTCTAVLIWGATQLLKKPVLTPQGKLQRPLLLWLSWPLALILVVMAIRSTTDHRPANPATFAITADALVNSLVINSPYSVLYAAYSMRHEARSSDIYGKLEPQTMLKAALDWPWLQSYQFKQAAYPTLHQQTATMPRTKPLNLVIILQESMGATFVKSLGGVGVTPELEQLKAQGIWFDQLYATGTRSVRGIEAVVAGFMPTPAQSVVKLSNSQQNFATIASILQQQGYHTQFVYGGEAHFDNMRGFFSANGFSEMVDQNNMPAAKFIGSWGASDEDVFDSAHLQLQRLHQQQQPFFSLIFTSSNHEPFEFPDGRIDLHEQPKNTVNNAVKYADWAMAKFIRQAKQSAYWQDTLFLIVADHDNRVYGSNLVPVEKFQIPGLMLGGSVKPGVIKTLSSQIDLAPTLLSMIGVSACHPLLGRDLTLDSSSPGRALLQFDNYFALMEQHQLTILKPDQTAVLAHYDQKLKQLTLSDQPVSPAQYQKALAQVQLPSYLYRERKYPAKAQCDVVAATTTIKVPTPAK